MEGMDKENGKKEVGDVEASGAPPLKSSMRMPQYSILRIDGGKSCYNISPVKRSDMEVPEKRS